MKSLGVVVSLLSLACRSESVPEVVRAPDAQRASDAPNAEQPPELPASAARDLGDRFETAPGLGVTLWAESPQFYNPTALDVDARGRLWVAEAVNYRKWNGRNPGLGFPEGDRIVILEDTNHDGVCDSSKVFVQDTDLVAPLGIAVLGERVIVSCSPNAIVYTDTDGDDVADSKEILLSGFGGHDHDHGLHSFVGGPDGKLWFNTGNAGPHVVTDKSGWTLRSGSIYNDGGPTLVDNRPRMKSDDGRVWTGGLVLSIEPDGTHLAVRAHNFRNNYEVALDSFGNMFQSDNDDGPPVGRTLWCMEGANHGFFSSDGSRFWSADQRPGQSIAAAHWHQDDPGVVPMGCINGGGGPTGVVVNEGDMLGAELVGAVLDADAGANVVYAHLPKRSGAGFELEKRNLIRARFGAGHDDEAHLFRPSDVAIGADGAAYVADWFDPSVGGHAMADQVGYGRILRVALPERRSGLLRNDLASLEQQIAGLCSPVVGVRWQAWQKLAARGDGALAALQALATNPNARLRARALFLLARLDDGVETVEQALLDPDPNLRIAAFRAVRAARRNFVRYAAVLVNDASPAVRAEAAVALREVPWAEKRTLVVQLAELTDPADRFELEAVGLAATDVEAELWGELVARSAVNSRWAEQKLAFAWRLHPTAALETLLGVVRSNAPLAERRRALDGVAFVPDRNAAEAMLDLALAGPEDVRSQAAWWVRFRDTNDWSAYGLGRSLGDPDLGRARLAWSSGLVAQGLGSFDIDVRGATHVFLVATEGGNGNGYDWADWIEPKLVGPGCGLALEREAWIRAEAGWGSVNVDRNCNGGALAIDGATFEHGIGTHAASTLVFRVPDGGFERLVGRFGPDDGGAQQPGTQTSVEFQVWLDAPEDRSAYSAALATVVDLAAGVEAARAAADELARTSEGALALVHFAEQERLGEDVRLHVGELLARHADPAVRALAAGRFRSTAAPKRTTASLDELVALAALDGDRRRGADAFFGEEAKCASCHVVRGRGAEIGPDLSSIRTKYSPRELFDHILQPSKAIEFGYQAWTLETVDGFVYTGFVQAGDVRAGASGTGNVVLKTTTGEREVIPENEIETAVLQATSLMPDDVALGLPPRTLADIAAFLQHDPSTPPKLGAPIELFDGKSLVGWTFHLDAPNAHMEDVWSVKDGILRCKGNPIGYIRTVDDFTSYVLEVEWRFVPGKPPGNSGVLLRMHGPDKVWPKSIEAQLQHLNAGDIWNIDEFPMQTAKERTSGRRTAKEFPTNEEPIGEWNRYVITLREGDLTLEVNGVVQNVARWCAELPGKICLQSEGAEIEFRTVRVTPIVE